MAWHFFIKGLFLLLLMIAITVIPFLLVILGVNLLKTWMDKRAQSQSPDDEPDPDPGQPKTDHE